MMQLIFRKYAGVSREVNLALLMALSFIISSACSKESPSPTNNPRIEARKLSLPAVGTTVVLAATKEVPVVQSGSSGSQKNVFLMILSDTKPLAYDSTARLLLYKNSSDQQPVYSFTVAELKAMVKTTRCSPNVAKYVEGAKAGEVLFCDGSLDLSKIHYFELKQSETDKDFSTSYTLDFVDKENDVVAITMAFN